MLDLPTEIIVLVFSQLDYRDLLVCALVCRLFHTVVHENASCQYTIDLAVSGMKNGPPSTLCHADRLAMLRSSQAAWHTLQWTTSDDVPMLQGTLYELYGGVLVQSNRASGRSLTFRRLPSHHRSIEEHVWSLDLDFIIRDFTFDPAQDLIVLIARPVLRPSTHAAWIETSIHIRSLTTGKVHPLATRSPVLVHDIDVRAANLTFMLQIHGDHVGVHFISHGTAPSELVVWNWKTGETVLNTYSTSLMAFGFLTKRLVLIGGFGDGPRLFVVDLESAHAERTEFEQVAYLCAFLYPACHPWVHPLNFLIRSDPCTEWTPHPSIRAPFSIGPGPRLYVVTVWVLHGDEVTPIDLFVLSSTLLEHVDAVGQGETRRDFEWSEWGPSKTRMMVQAPHSHVWVCYVFGTRFSAIVGDDRDSRVLELWDFNQLGIKRDSRRARREAEWHVEDASVLNSQVFVEEVRTGLPYRVSRRKLAAPAANESVFTEAMCSEDSVLLVDTHARYFRILSF